MPIRLGDIEVTSMLLGDIPIIGAHLGTIAVGASVSLNALTLSANSISEDAAPDTVVGAIQGTTDGSTVTLQDSAGSRFAISGGNIVRGATALDWEDATSHNITLRETHPDVTDPRDTVLTINVTNVLEVTLTNVTGTFAVTEDVSVGTVIGAIGNIQGATLSLADDASGKVAISGTNLVVGASGVPTPGSYSFTIRKTHADASNSPHDTVLSLTVNSAEEAETTALVARMSSAPNSTRRGHIDTFIAALKSAGVWAKLDCLQVYAAHDSQAALLNWKSTSYNGTIVNTFPFTADRGYPGNSGSGYINTGFQPVNFSGGAGSISAGVYQNGSNTLETACDMGCFHSGNSAETTIHTRWSNNMAYWGAHSGQAASATTDSRGFYSTRRTGASPGTISFRRGGATIDSFTPANAPALSSLDILIGCRNNDGVPGSYASTSRRYGLFYASQFLTDAEETAFYNAVQTYMTAVGANV